MNLWLLVFFFLSQSSSYLHCSTELCSMTVTPALAAHAHNPCFLACQQGTDMAFISQWDNSGWKGPQEVSSVVGSLAFCFITFNWNSGLQVGISVHHLVHIWNCQRDRDGKSFSSCYCHDLNTSSLEANSTFLPLLNALFYLRYSYSSSCCICFATIVKKSREKIQSKRISASCALTDWATMLRKIRI